MYVDIVAIILIYVLVVFFHRKKLKIGLYVLLVIWGLIYAYIIYFSRKSSYAPYYNFEPFWSYRAAFDGFTIKRMDYALQIVQNILVYIPLSRDGLHG